MIRKFSIYYAGATALVLGLSAGAMWAEAVIFVDFWRAVPPAEFLQWYAAHESKLVAFYSPVQISATLLALALPGVMRWSQGRWSASAGLCAVFGVAVIALFFIYFKAANAEFLSADPDLAGRIPDLLRSWGRWQWLRTALGVAAAIAALGALYRTADHLR